ncbi:hypothetical protein [Shimia sp.]|uniref:hypothetical protein n=1 Tax=Shimia sp. TaxID=1954381 RepID=UPI003298A258
MRVLLSFFCLSILMGCGSVDYENAPVGRFKGSLLVMWVSEEKFVFVPAPGAPLRFERNNASASLPVIMPEMMYTDGGSIPRAARLFQGFSPWGYAPAYMVHDWIFVARHCLTDGDATPAEQGVAQMTFQESAEVIAEAIQTLIFERKVQKSDVAPRVVSGAVAGPISYNRWTIKGACEEDRVSEQHRAEVEAALNQLAGKSSADEIILPGDPGEPGVPVTPAGIVAQISF